ANRPHGTHSDTAGRTGARIAACGARPAGRLQRLPRPRLRHRRAQGPGRDPAAVTGARMAEIAPGKSWAAEITAGEMLAITAQTVTSVVCIAAANRRERFDQARTKVYNMKIWASAGDALYS